MKNGFIISALALVFGGGLVLSSCTRTVYYTPRPKRPSRIVVAKPGPPPHAPAHGYRHKYGTTYLVFDSGLRVYRVEGYPGYYFYDGRYYRDGKDGWEICIVTSGPWEQITDDEVPENLKPKRKKEKRGRDDNGQGHAWGKDKDNWKDSGTSKDELKRHDHPAADRDARKNKRNGDELNKHPESRHSGKDHDKAKNDDKRAAKARAQYEADKKAKRKATGEMNILPEADERYKVDDTEGKGAKDAKGKKAGKPGERTKKEEKTAGKSTDKGKDAQSKDGAKKSNKGKGKSEDKDDDVAESKDSDKKNKTKNQSADKDDTKSDDEDMDDEKDNNKGKKKDKK